MHKANIQRYNKIITCEVLWQFHPIHSVQSNSDSHFLCSFSLENSTFDQNEFSSNLNLLFSKPKFLNCTNFNHLQKRYILSAYIQKTLTIKAFRLNCTVYNNNLWARLCEGTYNDWLTGDRTIAAKAGFWSFSMKIFSPKETGKCLGLCCVMCIWEQRKCEKLFLQEKAVSLRYRGWTTSVYHYEATARDDCTIYSCLVVIKCDNVFGTYAELTIKCMPRIDIRLSCLHRWFWLVRSLFSFYG